MAILVSIVILSGVTTIRVEQCSVRPFLVVHPMEACFINRDISLGFGHLKLTNPNAQSMLYVPTFAPTTTHCFLLNWRPYILCIKGKQNVKYSTPDLAKNMTESFKASSITNSPDCSIPKIHLSTAGLERPAMQRSKSSLEQMDNNKEAHKYIGHWNHLLEVKKESSFS